MMRGAERGYIDDVIMPYATLARIAARWRCCGGRRWGRQEGSINMPLRYHRLETAPRPQGAAFALTTGPVF
jgi:hypothetical protein